jgi:tetratricopeptide (TPR) repeat protein
MANGSASLVITVTDEAGNLLDKQALIKLYSNTTSYTAWGTTQKQSHAQFDSVFPGDYEIEASAAGFETKTEPFNVITGNQIFNIIVRLKLDGGGDSSSTKPGQLLAPRAQKETEKGLAGLKSGNLNDAQRHLEAAFALAPTNADVAFLLGYMYLQKKDAAQAQGYFEKATAFNPDHVRALTALGHLYSDEKDYEKAVPLLEKAVSLDAGHWEAHWILAGAYLHLHESEQARQQAELAIQSGKGAASGAEVELGEALANLGKTQDAIQAFQIFLQTNPKSPAVPQVQGLITSLQNPPKLEEAQPTVAPATDPFSVSTSTLAAPDAKLSLAAWGPPNVDDETPVVAVGARCPSDLIIKEAGERVKELVDHLANFDATEEVVHESLDELGRPTSKEARKFDYTATISEPRPDVLRVEEYRNSKSDNGSFPGGVATHGLPALAFVFHPDMRSEFDLVCEGLGSWKGEATWLIHFRQRPNQPSHLQSFDFANASFAVDMKGRAWISASNYQIMRLEADLVSPLKNIQLLTEHQVVEYRAVKFTKADTTVWLPAEANIYMDFRRQRFHLRHSFSHYMLFSVGTSQKISQPKMPDTTQEAPKQPN